VLLDSILRIYPKYRISKKHQRGALRSVAGVRLCLAGFRSLGGAVMADPAAGGGPDNGMALADIMTGDSADRRALEAALGKGWGGGCHGGGCGDGEGGVRCDQQ